MSRWTLPLIIAAVLSISISLTPARAQAAQGCGYPDVNAEGAIVLSGDGQLNTRPFDLIATAYTVRWSARAPSKLGLGNLILTLKRTDGPFPQELLVNMIVNQGDAEANGETQVYLTKAGAHYLDVMAPASWTVTITRQS